MTRLFTYLPKTYMREMAYGPEKSYYKKKETSHLATDYLRSVILLANSILPRIANNIKYMIVGMVWYGQLRTNG